MLRIMEMKFTYRITNDFTLVYKIKNDFKL